MYIPVSSKLTISDWRAWCRVVYTWVRCPHVGRSWRILATGRARAAPTPHHPVPVTSSTCRVTQQKDSVSTLPTTATQAAACVGFIL